MKPLLTHPTLRGDRLAFLSEDDLWTCSAEGGLARRLTNGVGRLRTPRLSRDGSQIAVSCTEEGSRDVHVLHADGGPLTRLTWLGGDIRILGFTPDDDHILFVSNRDTPFSKHAHLRTIPVVGGVPESLPWGTAVGFDWEPGGDGVVLCRHTDDLARWRRYRGGRVGQLWVDAQGSGTWARLPALGGDLATPLWIADRIWFVSDHTGHANLHSSAPDGSDVQQHTFHEGHAVRFPTHDSGRIVYALGGDLWRLETDGSAPERLDIETRSQRTQTQRRHPSPMRFLESVALHPGGHTIALTTRGKPYVGGLWEGPLRQLGVRHGVRHRKVNFLADGQRLIWCSDETGEPRLEVTHLPTGERTRLSFEPGRVNRIVPGPKDIVAVVGHRGTIALVDVTRDHHVALSAAPGGHILGVSWSTDGEWITWSESVARHRSRICLANVADLEAVHTTLVTEGRFRDYLPDFDPLGRFLYFLSDREFDPVPDRIYFGYAFPKGSRPYLVTLDARSGDPFQPQPRELGKPKPQKPPESLNIDLDGIAQRVLRFPLSEGRYTDIRGLPSGKVLLERRPMAGSLTSAWSNMGPPEATGTLFVWDFLEMDLQTVHTRVSGFVLDAPRKTMALRSGDRVRVFPADPDKGKRGELKKHDPIRYSRKTHWVDLGRARLTIDPPSEWMQMFEESWRLLRDNFWDVGMSGVDWQAVRERYRPLLHRVSTRSELSDVLWCMGGELGTSHAYEMGGEYRPGPGRAVGRLGVDVCWSEKGWKITALHRGDPGESRSSPLAAIGIGADVGTLIHAIDGQPVSADQPLGALLTGFANRPVDITLSEGGAPRTVVVRAVADDSGARYRSWVRENRARVHAESAGRAGYVHIPNMGSTGFADFARDYLAEADHDALVVDLRYNRGGHVSQLILGRLMQRRIAYTQSRHFGLSPYPLHSVLGPMVALTNEFAGSDGDIFSHNWKQLGLGPLVGTRTWGGVVGISPRNPLVDRAITTQPEFAYWFADGAGFDVEGYGTDPDIEVVHTPMDSAAGLDPQLDKALELLEARIAEQMPKTPDLGKRPDRSS